MMSEAFFARVLVVDDFEPWREFACGIIHEISGLAVVGEASDGIEAVQKARELQPDLVILDVGLPGLNGIEVAKNLSTVCPGSKVIFLSENDSADIVQEAYRVGAYGYVIKSHSGIELAATIQAWLKHKKS